MKPTVTLGVCVKNCEGIVKEAINSIIDQSFPHECMEVIFMDDGSEDGTLSVILDSVSRMDMQVKVYHTEWGGLGPARNTVVDNASGEFIVWVDGDMILPKDFVKKQVESMEQNPTVGIAKGKYGMCCINLVSFLESADYEVRDFKSKGKVAPNLALGTGGSIYRIKALRQVGGFDESIKGVGEDVEVEYRIRSAGWLLYMTEAVFYERRRETWGALWDEYSWQGYSLHYLSHKNRGIPALYEMVPPVGLLRLTLRGILHSIIAYKLTRRKAVFLLPLQCIFKMTAWCLGFLKSHMDSNGHAFREI